MLQNIFKRKESVISNPNQAEVKILKNTHKIILDKKIFSKNTDLLLYLASRSENIELIKKNYKKIILIDRFIDSTIAYQHYGMGVNLRIINQMNNFLLSNIRPNFTFLNIVNSRNMIERLKKRKNLKSI